MFKLFVSFLFILVMSQGSLDCKSSSAFLINDGFTEIAKKAIPATVFIRVDRDPESRGSPDSIVHPFEFFGDDFWRHFFGNPQAPRRRAQPLVGGSGFLVRSDGYIVTNAHVVKDGGKILVTLPTGKEMDATLVGVDIGTDIAIIKIAGENYPYLSMGNSDELEIGAWVAAVGSPLELNSTLTVGVVSAKGRHNLRIIDLEDFIQTDAAINPGNSGGPLLNLKAEVIGVNTAIVSKSGGYMGICFAVPSNIVSHVVHQLIKNGSISRGTLGVSLQPIDQDLAEAFGLERPEGVLVSEVLRNSPASEAGLQQGDIIISYNSRPVKSVGSFKTEMALLEPGEKIVLQVYRNGKKQTMSIALVSHDDILSGNGGILQQIGIDVSLLSEELSRDIGVSSKTGGLVITKVRPGSPAALAGIRPGYLIVSVNHQNVSSYLDLEESLKKTDPKQKRVLFLTKQGGNLNTRFYSIKLK